MDVTAVSPALRQRLGADATGGLLALLEASRQEWSAACAEASAAEAEMTSQAFARLEQQLGGVRDEIRAVDVSLRDEIRAVDVSLRDQIRAVDASLRDQIRAVDTSLRDQIGAIDTSLRDQIRVVDASLREEISLLRTEMREGDAALRLELRDTGVTLVREIAALGATLRKEMADQRVELFKWSFAFWFGQIVTLGGLMTLLFRTFLA
jgi:hypothetical protein